ncbi:hypothetical protein RO3G_05130 [Rhizopus delemar RA 99-880]|uniref:Uncharacterized protein n=1 Tax=Rhizopus delemar (strain RA 99-880 / ATCC MYA-4621 / FGSC 9543 / NRRL 43880) TaxID=246409 RepID=I1BW45_RHIO9|nr:hypothetical protein RO3G_05130 [Rhizopus delemar RA 99-880]|eukprot:EIE80425.1 hypothetical protein RO3G_05130 [Rhizopus delemar RA 99-880]
MSVADSETSLTRGFRNLFNPFFNENIDDNMYSDNISQSKMGKEKQTETEELHDG